jgi:type 1 glutamine amidotransferase
MTRRTFMAANSAVAVTAAAAGPPAALHSRKKILLLTGASDLPYHDWRESTAALRLLLDRAGIFDVALVEEPRGLNEAALAGYDAVLLNYHGPRLGAVAERALEKFVSSGRGLVAFHMSSYGEWFGMERQGGKWRSGPGQGWTGWRELIGASWKPENIGHTRRGAFAVKWVDGTHPVSSGLALEFVANDELYHKLDLTPQARVIADAHSDPAQGGTGRREPVIWTVQHGGGRVFFTTLGHDAMALYQPGVIDALARGVEWAASGRVTLEPLDLHSSAGPDPVRMLVVTGGHAYPVSFYSMLNDMPGIQWRHALMHSEVRYPIEKHFDVLLLHDMYDDISDRIQQRLRSFVEAGKGVISLHHSIVNYGSWPWWYREVTGGKFFVKEDGEHKKSAYREDVEFLVTPVKGTEKHPVLAGVGPLWVCDELYKGMWHSPNIVPLMETAHPDNDRPVVYAGPHRGCRSLYIQLGHSDHTMRHPGFRRLMRNAVMWAARRT